VLELTLGRLRDATGSAQVTPATLEEAERILVTALEQERTGFAISPNATRMRAAVRRLEFDLLRYLRHEAGRGGSFRPEHLELRFGPEDDAPLPPLVLDDGTRLRGAIDRVDVHAGWGLVRDYKSGKADAYKAADWKKENRFQGALYMLAVERLLGLRAAGAVYTPLAGKDRRSRGLVAEEVAAEVGADLVDNDVQPAEGFEERMRWAQEAVAEAARKMRSGELCSTPDGCAYRGGCSHPSICRVES
jgi:ATP-dependent helicase/DNAse subunit B